MITLNMAEFNKTMKQAIGYSEGFLNGAVQNQRYLNEQVAEIIKEQFYKYVDSVARLEPDRFHHVYEWGMVGNDAGRLFRIEAFSGQQSIRFVTDFMQSTSTSPTATEPFVDKASVSEEGSLITLTPRDGGVLSFQSEEGDMVFTPNEITIEQPGGPGVRGSFAAVTKEFFENYLNSTLVRELQTQLSTAMSFEQGWNNNMNYGTGQRRAKQWLTIDGGIS